MKGLLTIGILQGQRARHSFNRFFNHVLLDGVSIVNADLKLLKILLQIMKGLLTIGILQGQRT